LFGTPLHIMEIVRKQYFITSMQQLNCLRQREILICMPLYPYYVKYISLHATILQKNMHRHCCAGLKLLKSSRTRTTWVSCLHATAPMISYYLTCHCTARKILVSGSFTGFISKWINAGNYMRKSVCGSNIYLVNVTINIWSVYIWIWYLQEKKALLIINFDTAFYTSMCFLQMCYIFLGVWALSIVWYSRN
jgi:hypothetical protein